MIFQLIWRYQPINQKEKICLKEIWDLYLKERIDGALNQVEALLNQKVKEEQKPKQQQQQQQQQQQINQQKQIKYNEEYKKKTFFIFKNVEEENYNKKIKEQQLRLTKNIGQTESDKLLLECKQLKSKKKNKKIQIKKRIRVSIKEYLQKHYQLKLSLNEAMIHRIFKREPFVRPNSENFFMAVKSNDLEKVKEYLMRDKYFVYQFDSTLQTPLHWAAKRGYLDVAEQLINHNCDVDSKDQLGRTPLFFAYREGQNKMAKLLLLKRASPWSSKRNNIDQAVYSRHENEKTSIKIAKQVINEYFLQKYLIIFCKKDTFNDDDGKIPIKIKNMGQFKVLIK